MINFAQGDPLEREAAAKRANRSLVEEGRKCYQLRLYLTERDETCSGWWWGFTLTQPLGSAEEDGLRLRAKLSAVS